jgi:hypothetical protein
VNLNSAGASPAYPVRICRSATRALDQRAIAGASEPLGSQSLIMSKHRQNLVIEGVEVDPPEVDVAQTGE